jgi:hypothetical protein
MEASGAKRLSFCAAAELVRERLGCSVGRSHAELRKALASGEVRHDPACGYMTIDGQVLLAADDGILTASRNGFPSRISADDLIDWLDQKFGKPSPAEIRRAAKARGVGACRDWLIEERKRGPQQKRKRDYKIEGMNRFGVGSDQFKTAWKSARVAVPRDDWGNAGRPPKAIGRTISRNPAVSQRKIIGRK